MRRAHEHAPERLDHRAAAVRRHHDGLFWIERRSGGTGRRAGLKIRWPSGRVGSSPTFGIAEGERPRTTGGRGLGKPGGFPRLSRPRPRAPNAATFRRTRVSISEVASSCGKLDTSRLHRARAFRARRRRSGEEEATVGCRSHRCARGRTGHGERCRSAAPASSQHCHRRRAAPCSTRGRDSRIS